MTVRGGDTRDRLLRAAAELMDEAGAGGVSTRAVCERAGVQAPTLYHHFGSKDGLLRAVVDYGLHQYTAGDDDTAGSADPVARLRRGWDEHVAYGLKNPSFYLLLYGQIAPGKPCAITAVAEERLMQLLTRIEERGQLTTSCEEAARQIVAANVGVTLYLIGRSDDDPDLDVSVHLRENVLGGLVREAPAGEDAEHSGRAAVSAAAAALLSALRMPDEAVLSTGEMVLITEWLQRLRRSS